MAVEKEKKKRGFSFLKLALFLLILVLISGVAIYSFLNINPAIVLSEGFTGLYNKIFTAGAAELKETVKSLLPFDPSERVNCTTVANNLVVATVSSVKIMDPDGQEKGYIPLNLKKPYVQSYKDDILAADLEGRYFGLIKEGRILWEKNIDEDIVNASISDAWVLLITESKQSGYKRTIRAYSRDGQEISFRNVSNYYPYAVMNFPEYSKGSFMVSSIEASGLDANGLFEILDAGMNQKASIKGTKELFGGSIPLDKGNLLVYGEKSLIVMDQAYKTVWTRPLTGFSITGAAVIQQKYPVIAELNTDLLARERRHETNVNILNADGSQRAGFVIDGNVTGVVSKGRTAAVIAGSEVYFVNSSGEIMDKFTAKSNVTGVYLAKDDLAYVATSDLISRVKIKVSQKFLGIF